MQLSVVIVNYNVKHFLEQCLLSVRAAMRGLEGEVFVVDNNSVDGSVAMVRDHFPEVILMANRENVGFARANNVAMRMARGKYVLLLNPDTVVQEDTFRVCIDFMEKRPDAGGLGVKMLNGEGEFLPESKRALPTPWVAFYKIFGLAWLFPNSRKFGKYHLSYLNRDQNHSVEALSGAFMWMRKSVLDQIGLLDEDYFMYGEDIDLSYRIILGGYKNYYLGETKIIHYKGESTKKGSLNYVIVFYKAMMIFAQKHFAGNHQSFFMFLIRLAIYLRAGISVFRRLYETALFPVVEFAQIWGLTLASRYGWEYFIKHTNGDYYPPFFDWTVAPVYALIFCGALWASGAYKRPFRFRSIATGVFGGFVTIATMSYVFKDVNFSRAIVMLSAAGAGASALFNRGTLNWLRSGNFLLNEKSGRRVLIVGDKLEAERVKDLLERRIFYDCRIVGLVSNEATQDSAFVGDLGQLDEIVRFYQAEEIVFCNASMATEAIIDQMSRLAHRKIDFKIAPPNTDYIVGPNTILTTAQLQSLVARLSLPEMRIKKRVFDLGLSAVLVALFPLTFWLYKRPASAFQNLFSVLLGRRHLVGYIEGGQPDLPKLKSGLLNIGHLNGSAAAPKNPQDRLRLDRHYARNYSVALDWEIALKGLAEL